MARRLGDTLFECFRTNNDTKKAEEQNLGQIKTKTNQIVVTVFTNIMHNLFTKVRLSILRILVLVTSESQLLEMLRVFNVASPVVTTWLELKY